MMVKDRWGYKFWTMMFKLIFWLLLSWIIWGITFHWKELDLDRKDGHLMLNELWNWTIQLQSVDSKKIVTRDLFGINYILTLFVLLINVFQTLSIVNTKRLEMYIARLREMVYKKKIKMLCVDRKLQLANWQRIITLHWNCQKYMKLENWEIKSSMFHL